jgi:hypothetical protein
MGAPAPTIGGGMAVTNAPTAAPSPAPQQLREGSVVRQNGVTYRITNGVPVPVTGTLIQSMAFDPTQPFEVVEDPQAQAGGAPRFDPSQAFEVVDDGQTSLIEGVGNSIKRGWTMSQMASEMEKPAPDPQRVAALQQEMQAVPPSDEYMTVMDDRRAPEESWTAFKSAPVKVLAELMGESFSAFAGQMIQKAPNRVAIGLGARCRDGCPRGGHRCRAGWIHRCRSRLCRSQWCRQLFAGDGWWRAGSHGAGRCAARQSRSPWPSLARSAAHAACPRVCPAQGRAYRHL